MTRYVAGPSLDDVVTDEGPLGPDELVRLGRGLAEALEAIHEVDVIHRDLKPGNVLLEDGDPVVIDFGIAHIADDVRITRSGLVMGTPGYLSPEVVGGSPVTEATDWWGWAATLAFAASGRPPFGRGPMDVVLGRVSRGETDLTGVDPRLARCWLPRCRPSRARRRRTGEVVDALERYAAGWPGRSHDDPAERASPGRRTGRVRPAPGAYGSGRVRAGARTRPVRVDLGAAAGAPAGSTATPTTTPTTWSSRTGRPPGTRTRRSRTRGSTVRVGPAPSSRSRPRSRRRRPPGPGWRCCWA